jgi:hypothetical protein
MNCAEGEIDMPRPKETFNLNVIIKEKKCAKCGKNFIVAVEHRYKEGGKYYCSWTCYNHRHDEQTREGEYADKRI